MNGGYDGGETVGGTDSAGVAVVLSGGGAYAAYGVGVMRALFAGKSPATGGTPLDPGIYTGTSAGALNAAFMVSRPGRDNRSVLAELEAAWVGRIGGGPRGCGNGVYRIRGNPFRYLAPACFPPDPLSAVRELAGDALFFARDALRRGQKFLATPGDLGKRVLELFDLGAFIADAPFQKSLYTLLRLDGIRRSDKVLRVAATNWTTGAMCVFGNDDLTDEVGYEILAGAAAIPGLFRPRAVGEDLYVDGSLVMSTPLKPALAVGAYLLHCIYLDPDVKNIPIDRMQDLFDVLDRTRVIDWASRMNEDLATAQLINRGLDTLTRLAAGDDPSDAELRPFLRVAQRLADRERAGLPYRKLTVHRYRPRDDLGGPLGILNFDRDRIAALIERGYHDAVTHDCATNQCLLPA